MKISTEFQDALLKFNDLIPYSPDYIIAGHAAMVLQGHGYEQDVKDIDTLVVDSDLKVLLDRFDREQIKVEKTFDALTGKLSALYWARKPIAFDFYTPESRHTIPVESPKSHIYVLIDTHKDVAVRPKELLIRDYRALVNYHKTFLEKYIYRLEALGATPLKFKKATISDEHSNSTDAIKFEFGKRRHSRSVF